MAGANSLNARQAHMLEHVSENGSAQIKEFSAICGVSEATVRRDFDELTRLGLVERVHGGIVRTNGTSFERVHSEKMNLMLDEKLRIASYAASIVTNGDSIFLDSGTTTYFIARELAHHRDLTVITNNLDIAQSVHFDPSVSLIVTGGLRRDKFGVLIGSITEQVISSFYVDKSFIGCDSIDPKAGIFNTNFQEVSVKQCITRCGKKTILVTDSSKFATKALAKVCDLDAIDMIITDSGIEDTTLRAVKKKVPNTVCV